MSVGELKKHAVTMNGIQNNLPKIVRTPDKIDETIQANVDAQYKVLYVPLSKIEEAKKDFPKKHNYGYSSSDGEGSYEENDYDIYDSDEVEKWFETWFGDSS